MVLGKVVEKRSASCPGREKCLFQSPREEVAWDDPLQYSDLINNAGEGSGTLKFSRSGKRIHAESLGEGSVLSLS